MTEICKINSHHSKISIKELLSPFVDKSNYLLKKQDFLLEIMKNLSTYLGLINLKSLGLISLKMLPDGLQAQMIKHINYCIIKSE